MKFNSNKYTRGLLIGAAIIAVSCAVSLIMLATYGFKTPNPSNKKQAETPASQLAQTPDYGENYINNIIFIGDYTISPLRSAALLGNGADTTQIWSGENNSLSLDYGLATATIVYPETGESISISEAISRKLPSYVIITLGGENGVAYCTEQKFKEYYGSLISTIKENSPDTKIILQSVFPISKQKQKNSSDISNDKIDRANGWIVELANEYSVKYLNSASILKDSKGNLDAKYDSGDGVTLNSDGYRAMLNYIRTHGYK